MSDRIAVMDGGEVKQCSSHEDARTQDRPVRGGLMAYTNLCLDGGDGAWRGGR